MYNVICKTVTSVFVAFCLAFCIVKLLCLNDSIWYFANKAVGVEGSIFLRIVSFFSVFLIMCFILLLLFHCFKVKFRCLCLYIDKINPVKLSFIIFFVSMLFRMFMVFALKSDFTLHEDMGNAYDFALQLVEKNCITHNVSYAMSYERYVNIALIFVPVLKVFGTSVLTISCTEAVLFSVAYVAWFDVLRRKTTKYRAFFVTLLLGVLITEACLVNLFIHEAVLFLFITVFVWLVYAAVPDSKNSLVRILLFVLACIFLALGANCNQMGYVFALAFLLTVLVNLFKNKVSFKNFIKIAVALIVVFATMVGVSGIVLAFHSCIIDADSVENVSDSNTKIPFGWSLYVGGAYEYSGQWSLEDKVSYYPSESMIPKSNLYEYRMKLLKDRYMEYLNNPVKYISHIYNKLKVTYGTNSYAFDYAYVFSQTDIINKPLYLLVSLASGLPMLFICVLLIFSFKTTGDSLSLVLRAFLCGAFFVLLIVETSAKYVSCFWALMLFVLCLEWDNISAKVVRIEKAVFHSSNDRAPLNVCKE